VQPRTVEPITFTIEETAVLLGVGKTLAYELANRGELPAVRLGRRLVVPRRALEEWLVSRTSRVA
jgi:excisionase family DNA binding protein